MAMHSGIKAGRNTVPLRLFSIVLVAFTACAPIPTPGGENRPFGQFDEPPMPVDGIAAIVQNIPATAPEASVDGLVVLSAFIDSNGKIRRLTMMRGVPGMNKPIADAIMRTPWKPAKWMGKAVEARVNILVEIQSGKVRVLYPIYDHPPMPVGGYEALHRRIRYPKIAIAAGVKGLVIVQAFVNEDGTVTSVVIQEGLANTGLDEAAMRGIERTPFTPATLNGEAMATWVAIPVNFWRGIVF